MLYKFNPKDNNIEMLQSYNYEDIGGLEKDLENLLANNLADLYYADGQLMPIFQERSWQAEPDLCALDKNGNLVIFELKRGKVPGDTTIQIMRYCQDYGRKNYFELSELYKKYSVDGDLALDHAEAFGLDTPLRSDEFNRSQKLVIIGSDTDSYLMDAIDYWKSEGLDIDYIPYRFYDINGEKYFEFFAKPYDYHLGKLEQKGVLFDTNSTYDSNAIWDMMKNHKVSAYGGVKNCINTFNKGDYVLYYHKGWGVIGAAKIKSSKAKENKENDELYFDVDLLTPKVQCESELKYVSAKELKELLNKDFYFASTIKRPYLSIDEAEKIIELLLKKYH
jgi:predicted RNA-binding protein with PUA-like domain